MNSSLPSLRARANRFGVSIGNPIQAPARVCRTRSRAALRRRDVSVQLAQFPASHARRQADGENHQRHARQQASQAHGFVRLDSFQPHEPQQIKAGHGEQHDPGRQETLAREPSPICSTWSTLARYFRLAARITKSHHHLHARQPAAAPRQALQVRRKQRQQEERQRQPAGEHQPCPASGRTPPLPHRSRQQRPHERPHAGERRERERQPHQQRAGDIRPFPEDFRRVSMPDGMVISNAPSRLRPNARNSAAMNPFTQGLEPSCTTPTGPRMAVVSQSQAAEQHHDPQAKDHRLRQPVAPPAVRAIQEVGHGDGDHGEDSRA